MGTARRDFLKFAGGISAGVVFTPVPWKVLDDLSIWTQNWSWLPRPLQGEIAYKYTNCTLCPTACGVRAKCVAGQPFQVAGIANHPVGRATLCPAGLAAHQLPYAPARFKHASVAGAAANLRVAMEAAASKVRSARSVLVLDGRPGRCASDAYRDLAARLPGWKYAAAPGSLGMFAEYSKLTGFASGLDYDAVKTIVSFGVPVLHSWSTPGRLLARRGEFHLTQIEPSQSRTAAFANRWLSVRPGSEDAIALGIANVLLEEELASPVRASDWADYLNLLQRMPAEKAASLAGVPLEDLRTVARQLAAGPSLALGNSVAIAGLNVLLGDQSAIVHRGPVASLSELYEIPDGSIDVVLADVQTDLPPAMVRAKLNRGGVLIALSPYTMDLTSAADIVIPAPAWLEIQEDVPAPMDSPLASFSVAQALLPMREASIGPAAAILKLAGSDATMPDLISRRTAEIHRLARGTVLRYGDGSVVPVKGTTLDELITAFSEGGCWTDERGAARLTAVRMLGGRAPEEVAKQLEELPAEDGLLLAVEPKPTPVPMLGKLYRESDLYAGGDVARVHPTTAAERGLANGQRAKIKTSLGTGKPLIQIDTAAAPGLVHIHPLPNLNGGATALRLCNELSSSPVELGRA